MRLHPTLIRVFFAITLLLSLIPAASGAGAPRFTFVANTGDNTLSTYTVNATTGLLRNNGYVLVGSKPVGATVTPAGNFLYVANSGSSNISAFAVNVQNGSLTPVTGSPFAAKSGPSAVATDPGGKFLYVTNKTSGNISAYTINAVTGVLTAVAGSPFTSGTSPVALQVDPSGKFLYAVNSGSSNVSAYTINGTNGALTAIAGSPFAAGTTPAGISIAPSGKFVYVANGGSNSVSGFSLNSSGVLTAIAGSPFAAGTKPSAVAVDPLSQFVYVTNSTSNNVSEYTLNSTTGVLSSVAGSPVSAGSAPAAVAVDPSAKFVYIANAKSGDISTFALNSGSGALSAIVPGPFRTRKSPSALVVSAGTTNITYTPSYVFAADFSGFAGSVPVLSASPASGALTPVVGSPFGTGTPRAIAASVNGKFVYTANSNGNDTLGEYTVNPSTGVLTSVGTIATGSSPHGVAVDPSSRFVYGVGLNGLGVYGYTINPSTGTLTLIAGSPFTTNVVAPIWVAVDPTGRFLMVAEACCANTAGITVFNISPVNGKLTPVSGSPFLPPAGVSQPTAVTVDPTGRYVYVANGAGFGTLGVTAYSINAGTGKLALVGTELPGGTSPSSIVTDVTGKYVYETGSQSTFAGYSINNATGQLTALASSPFQASQLVVAVKADPSGKFLYLSAVDQILGYSIDPASGNLTVLPTSPYAGGNELLDLAISGTVQ